jgi:cysteinyl-tRNA synthetase
MSKRYLGPTFDVHMGGVEHIPIHHTNEIAQSECANGVHYVDYWLHNEHLLVDGKKMAKSEGTSYVMKDIANKGVSPLALRYFFLQAHYRSKQNFTWEALEASETALKKIKSFTTSVSSEGKINEVYKKSFDAFVNDDFNVTGALSIAWDMIKDKKLSDEDKKATLLDFDKILGLGLESNEKIDVPEKVLKLVKEREEARKANNWKRSDELRDEIAKHGFVIKDTSAGQKIEKA